MKTAVVLITLSLLAGAFLTPFAMAQAQNVEEEIAAAESKLQAGRAAHLDLISPKNFEDAMKKLSDSKGRFERGGKIADIRKSLNESLSLLGKAEALEDVGKVLLEDALAAWSDALTSNAPEFAPKEWEDAKKAMYAAGRKIEAGDQNGARENAKKATEKIRFAELEAIRKDLLGRAKQYREEALAQQADKKASVTFERAESLLRQAEQVLQGDRYQRDEAKSLAAKAGSEYRHAATISGIEAQIHGKEMTEVERLILAHEEHLAEIAAVLEIEVSFDMGLKPATERIAAAVNGLAGDRQNLQEEVAGKNQQLDAAVQLVDSLDARLAELENRERTISAQLRARERFQENVRDVRQMFGPSEAEVFETDDGLLIRLHSMAFPSGSSEIRPEDFPLLTKVQKALRKFPDAPAVIEGHTDAQGDEDYNQALSERRAAAVSSYLMANMSGAGVRLSSAGYGEGYPIASNETPEGRAKNRRIDVHIIFRAPAEQASQSTGD
jgi:OOP family OmpA-OmpF porin